VGRPAALLLAPSILFVLLFLASPMANLIGLSFLTHSATDLWIDRATFENYAQALDGYYVDIFLRSLGIAGISTLCCIALGYPLAYFLARCSARVLAIGLFLLIVPLMVSTVIRAFGWLVLIGRNGMINQAFVAIGGEPVLDVMYTQTAVIIALVQLVLPLMVLPLMAAIENIPVEIEEAAANLGCGAWSRFRKGHFPHSLQGLISGTILCFAVSVSVVVTPALLGGRRGRMVGNEIYDQVLTGLNWPLASALSILLIVGILLLPCIGMVILWWRRSTAGRSAIAPQ
jgi:ABC-type spermidine/putrescine transport system permease subunit I